MKSREKTKTETKKKQKKQKQKKTKKKNNNNIKITAIYTIYKPVEQTHNCVEVFSAYHMKRA